MRRITPLTVFSLSSLGRLSLGLFFFGFLLPINLSADTPPSVSLNQALATCIGSSPQVNLAWTSTFTTTPTYHILRRVQGSLPFQEINAVTTTSYSDLGVVSDQSYEYQIQTDDGTVSNISLPTTKPYCAPTLTNPAPYCLADGPHMSISWSGVSGNVLKYEVHRINPDSTDIPFTVPAGTSSYDDGPALAGSSSYAYFIRAGWQDGKTIDSATIPQDAPSCPVILNAQISCQDVSPGGPSVHLSWNALLGVSKYQIYRKAQNETTYSLLSPDVIGATSADDTLVNSLPNAYDVAGQVSYEIKTSFSNGKSDSSPFSLNIPQCAPFLSTQNNCQNPAINLSWTRMLGVDNYNLYRTDLLPHILAQKQPNETSYVDGLDSTNCPGAKCTKTYYVGAVAGSIKKPSSSVTQSIDCSVVTSPTPAPTLNTPTAKCVNGDSHISLSWTPSNNIYYYTVYRTVGTTTQSFNWPATSFDEKVQSENSFSYWITAYGPGGNITSNTQPIQSVSCIPPTASTVSITPSCNVGNPVNTITWSPPSNTNIIRYEILRGPTSSPLAVINTFTKSDPEYSSHTWTDSGISPSTNYYYQVISYGPLGVAQVNSTNMPSIKSSSCIPDTPTITSPIARSCLNGTPQLTLSWAAGGANAKYYNLWRADGNNPFSIIKPTIDPATTTWTDISGAPATSYQYQVEAVGSLASQKAMSPPLNQTSYDCSPPGPFTLNQPAASFCQNVSTPAVKLSWGNSSNAVSYSITRANPVNTVAPVTSPYTVANGLIPGTSYTWQVNAIGPPGVKNTPSNTIAPLPIDYCTPVQPILTFTPKCDSPPKSNMIVAWNPADTNVTTYKIYRNGIPVKRVDKGVDPEFSARSWNDTNGGAGLGNSKDYTYSIKASGPTGLSNQSSDTQTKTLFCTPPTTPQNIKAQFQCVAPNATIPQVLVTWYPADNNPKSYTLSRVLGGVTANFALGNITTYPDTSITPGVAAYSYYVTASNDGGTSPKSTSTTVTPDPTTGYYCTPSTPVVSYSNVTCKNGAPANTLTWTDPIQSDTASYEIYRDTSNVPPASYLIKINSGTGAFTSRTWEDTLSLNSFTTYNYWVKAIGPNPPGLKSALSAMLPVTTANCAALPKPVLNKSIACGNNLPIPTLSWGNVTGALSYDLSRINPDTSVSTYATVNSPFTDNGDHALSFNGVNNYVQVAAANAGPFTTVGTGNFTISAWATNSATSGYRWIISNWSTTGTFFGKNSNGYFGGYFGNGTEANSNYLVLSNSSWHHYAATRLGSTVSFYVDGVAHGTSSLGTGSMNAPAPTRIGARGDSVAQLWTGAIDDVRVYNRALNSSEVNQLYTQGSSGNEVGLKGFWNFNEGPGAIAKDTSGNGNNGGLIGSPAPAWVSPVGKTGYGAPLDNKKQYKYTLKALGAGIVTASDPVVIPDTTSCLPAKPDLKTVPPVSQCINGSQQITLNWPDDSTNTLYWNVYKRKVGESFGLVVPPSPVASPPALVIDGNIISGTSYEYFVSAHGPNAGISPTDSDLTPAIQAPFCQNPPTKPIFTPLTPVAKCLGKSPRIYMSWGKDSTGNTLAYKIYRDLDTTNAICTVLPSDPLECWDPNVLANQSYYYWINALGSGQGNFTKSDISSPDTIVSDCSKTPPDPPSVDFGDPRVSSVASKQTVWIKWKDVGNADQYQIFRKKQGETTFALAPWWKKFFLVLLPKNAMADFANPLDTRSGTNDGVFVYNYPDNSVAETTTYQYLVRAINANGFTDSNITNPGILVPIGTPGPFTLSGSSANGVNLTWTPADTSLAGGAISYTVQRDASTAFDPLAIPRTVTTLNCPNANTLRTCTDPSPSGQPFYKVTAQNNGGKIDSNTWKLKLPLPSYKEKPPV